MALCLLSPGSDVCTGQIVYADGGYTEGQAMSALPPIAVIGAGLMGHGIAWIFAAAGHPVRLYDPDAGARHAVPQKLRDISQLLDRAPEAVKATTLCATLEEAVEGAGFVFEAVPENLALKREVFTRHRAPFVEFRAEDSPDTTSSDAPVQDEPARLR